MICNFDFRDLLGCSDGSTWRWKLTAGSHDDIIWTKTTEHIRNRNGHSADVKTNDHNAIMVAYWPIYKIISFILCWYDIWERNSIRRGPSKFVSMRLLRIASSDPLVNKTLRSENDGAFHHNFGLKVPQYKTSIHGLFGVDLYFLILA